MAEAESDAHLAEVAAVVDRAVALLGLGAHDHVRGADAGVL